MKKILLLITLLLSTIGAFGQNKVEQMNKIKKNKSYLYADMTMENKTDALEAAYKLLQMRIEDWATSHTKKTVHRVVATDIHSLIDTIFLNRVNMVQAFVYVKKSSVIPIYSKEGITIVDPDAQDIIIDDRIEPRKEQAAAAPAKEPHDTIVAAPAKSAPADSVRADRAVNANEAVGAIGESAEEPAAGKTGAPGSEAAKALDKITAVSSFFDLQKVMEPMREEGVITAYGKYSTMENPADCYLIIYDPAGNIRAVLGKGDGQRTNLTTNKQDSETNYRGCGAIWFKLKENS